jgi:hypothetical protein
MAGYVPARVRVAWDSLFSLHKFCVCIVCIYVYIAGDLTTVLYRFLFVPRSGESQLSMASAKLISNTSCDPHTDQCTSPRPEHSPPSLRLGSASKPLAQSGPHVALRLNCAVTVVLKLLTDAF